MVLPVPRVLLARKVPLVSRGQWVCPVREALRVYRDLPAPKDPLECLALWGISARLEYPVQPVPPALQATVVPPAPRGCKARLGIRVHGEPRVRRDRQEPSDHTDPQALRDPPDLPARLDPQGPLVYPAQWDPQVR